MVCGTIFQKWVFLKNATINLGKIPDEAFGKAVHGGLKAVHGFQTTVHGFAKGLVRDLSEVYSRIFQKYSFLKNGSTNHGG